MLKVKNSKRGGYRANAGRKSLPHGDKKTGLTIYISPNNLKKVGGAKWINSQINNKLENIRKNQV